MRPLVAVTSCHAMRERVKACRETWLTDHHGEFDVKFFLGNHTAEGAMNCCGPEDEVYLHCGDGYADLPAKTQALCRWALEQGYTHVFKCDDDTYVQLDRLYRSDFAQLGDYVGRKRGPCGGFPAPYGSGFSYWLNSRAMKVIASAQLTSDPAEDRWVGNTLLAAGIQCAQDYRYVVTHSRRNALSGHEGPRVGNTVISACEFEPQMMHQIHKEFKLEPAMRIDRKTEVGALTHVCVMVKTFLRDGYLLTCVRGIQNNMPGAKIVIVDDGAENKFKISWYSQLRTQGHATSWMPFDSGFGAKSNEALKFCDRKYVLIASDDFEFTPETRIGVENMIHVMETDPDVGVCSGRVNNQPYEALLAVNGSVVTETAGYSTPVLVTRTGVEYRLTDLTVNFSLIRKDVFKQVHWDDEVKIGGGEHGAFFMDVKKSGWKVAWLPNVTIHEVKGPTDWQDWRYPEYRRRARRPQRECLKKRGVTEYRCMGGSVEVVP